MDRYLIPIEIKQISHLIGPNPRKNNGFNTESKCPNFKVMYIRRLYTWKAPGDRSRHQVDYILVKHRFRNSVKDVQTLPGADIDSDHNLLVAKICTRLKKIIRFQKRRPQWELEKLYTQKQTVKDTLEGKFGAIECDSENVEVQWNNIKECLRYSQ